MVGKKSIFFTFIGIFVVAIMLIFVSIYTHTYFKDTMPATQLRFNIAEDFIESFENEFLPRGMYAISHDSLGVMVDIVNSSMYSTSSKPYVRSNIDNEVLAFQEIMLYGYLNESRQCYPEPCTELLNISSFQNQSFTQWMNNLTALVWEALRLNMTYNVSYLDLKQNASDGPWFVSASLNFDYTVFDYANDMSWTRDNITITTRIPIEGFVDPFIRYKSNKTINNVIRKYNHSGIMYADDVKQMIDDGTYIYDPRAPSFLQRFGRFSECINAPVSSCCGISSLVKPSDLNESYPIYATKYRTRSYVDFWYYMPRCEGTDLYSINGVSEMDDYRPFRIDQYHISLFNIIPNETALRSDAETNPCGDDDGASPLPVCTGINCGDGIEDSDEQCDDGDTSNTDACTNDCEDAFCGDGYKWSGIEECDDGNIIPGDGCDNVCELEGVDTDGDGIMNALDTDDDNDGVLDVSDTDSLDPNTCEDVDNDGCDDCAVGSDDFGPNPDNLPDNDGVDNDGDGYCEAGDCDDTVSTMNPGAVEICDDGLDNDCDGYIDLIDPSCGGPGAVCGNGIPEGIETCDDGHITDCGVCNADCTGPGTVSLCGDNVICPDDEVCDDGNTDDCDTCSGDCSAVVTGCGDGFVCGVEECDGTDLNGNDCTDFGFDWGTLSCDGSCTFDNSLCNNIFSIVGSINDTACDTDNGGVCELTYVSGIDVVGNFAFVASGNGIEVLDVTNPTNPVHHSSINDADCDAVNSYKCRIAYSEKIQIVGDYAYIASRDGYGGVEVMDITDPANLAHVGSIEDYACDQYYKTLDQPLYGTDHCKLDKASEIFVNGDYAYIGSISTTFGEGMNFGIVNISDPANPTYVSGVDHEDCDATTPGGCVITGSRGIYVVGDYAYVAAYWEHGVGILDIADIANPVHVGSFKGGSYFLYNPGDIQVVGNIAYIASSGSGSGGGSGLDILDITDPTSPTKLGRIGSRYARTIQVVGNYVFIGGQTSHVKVFDVSDPTAPYLLGSISDWYRIGAVNDIHVKDNYVYVASSDKGVVIIEANLP